MKAKTKSSNAQPRLLVDSEVVRQIRQHARSSNKTEVCGVLIGQDRDQRIEVAACIEGQNAQEAGAHVTFTQETWEHIYAVKDKKYPEERIVGWYHSHPGFGVFLSDHDTFIHKNFFSSPGQVAWVFDPHSDEEGCFGWVSGRIERLTRIGVVDRRGGEEAKESSTPDAGGGDAAVGGEIIVGAVVRAKEREPRPLKIARLDADERSSGSDSSLERLVASVFLYLVTLALGFALAWYIFPRVVVMPVLVDPQTGQLIDPQTGRVVADPQVADKPDSNKTQSSLPNQSGRKGDNAQPK
jgi:proteasome lid subunit RPN8/RPN11